MLKLRSFLTDLVGKLKGLLAGSSGKNLRPSIDRIQAFLPSLRLSGAPGATNEAVATDPAARPGPLAAKGRNVLLTAALSVCACLVICVAGTGAVLTARHAGQPKVSAPPLAPPSREATLQRIRAVGEQLNLETRLVGDRIVVYVPAGPTDTALNFAREIPSGYRPCVVDLPVLATLIGKAFADGGIDVTVDVAAGNGPAINISGHVPQALRPLRRQVLARVKAAIASDPALASLHFNETVTEDDAPLLLATLVGTEGPPMAFLASGPHAVGEAVLKHFKVSQITADHIELVRDDYPASSDAIMSVPLHGDSTLISGGDGQQESLSLMAAVHN